MKAFLTALLMAAGSARATEPQQCQVRAEVWEVGNTDLATAMDAMESPGAWRQSLLVSPGCRLEGSWVAPCFSTGPAAWVHSTRERIYPVEYSAGGGLSSPVPAEPLVEARPDSLPGFCDVWLRTKAHKDFEVRNEGWDFEVKCVFTVKGRSLLTIRLSEARLLDFVSFGFNPFAIPQPNFSDFHVSVTRGVEAGRWEILAAQSTPRGIDGKPTGRSRVTLVRLDRVH